MGMGDGLSKPTSAGVHTLTFNIGASGIYTQFVVIELAGLWTFDGTLGSQTGASTSPFVNGNVTPSGNDFQWMFYCGTTSNNEPTAPGGAWSSSQMGVPASGFPSFGSVWVQSNAQQGNNIQWGTLGVSDTWGLFIGGYKPPTATSKQNAEGPHISKNTQRLTGTSYGVSGAHLSQDTSISRNTA